MEWLKRIGTIVLISMVLLCMIAPAMAAEDNDDDNVRVLDSNGNDVTNENHVSEDDENDDVYKTSNDDGITANEIFSDDYILGQRVKDNNDASFTDFLKVRTWTNVLFANDVITAIAGLAFALIGVLILSGSGLSYLLNALMMVKAMLSLDGDVDEAVDKVHHAEKRSIVLTKGLGLTFVLLSGFCFMITFLE